MLPQNYFCAQCRPVNDFMLKNQDFQTFLGSIEETASIWGLGMYGGKLSPSNSQGERFVVQTASNNAWVEREAGVA